MGKSLGNAIYLVDDEETIKKKMDEHIERILAKKEISNEDYYLLCMVPQKIEGEEKLAEMQAKNEADKAAWEVRKKELTNTMLKASGLLN